MGFTYEEREGFSDILFTAEGKDLTELFISSWQALLQATVESPETVENQETRQCTLEDDDVEFLLYDFLGKFLYFRDAEGLILRVGSLEISGTGAETESRSRRRLEAMLFGEPLDTEKHGFGDDIKAVTFHEFSVTRGEKGKWRARVILDV